jgi:hypothetical protein
MPEGAICHVNQWHIAHLIAKQLCKHINNGLTHEYLPRDRPEDGDISILSISFQVTWKPAWVPEETMLTTPSGKQTFDNYTQNKTPIRKKMRTPPPLPPPQTKGWHPKHTTFNTKTINPDLVSAPTGSFEITRHPTNDNEVLLHSPDGTLLTRMTKARLKTTQRTIETHKRKKTHSQRH